MSPLRFGPGKISLAPVMVLALGTLPLASSDRRLLWLLLLPLVCAVWVLRARVVVADDGLVVCNGLVARRVAWSQVEGFDVPPSGWVRLLAEGRRVPLTALPRERVRRFLDAVREASR